MIEPIKQVSFKNRVNFNRIEKKEDKKEIKKEENYSTAPFNEGYLVNFTGLLKNNKVQRKEKLRDLNYDMTSSAEELLRECAECAEKYKSPEITEIHVILTSLKKISKYIEELDNGSIRYNQEQTFHLPDVFENVFSEKMFQEKNIRGDFKKAVDIEIEEIEKKLEKEAKGAHISKRSPQLSDSLLNSIYNVYQEAQNDAEDLGSTAKFYDAQILTAALYPDNNKFRQEVSIPLRFRLKESIMLDRRPDDKKVTIPFYDKQVQNIWKNLSVGTNMILLHDSDVNSQYIVDGISEAFRNSQNGFGNFKKDNTQIIEFNEYASQDYISEKIRQASQDKDKNYVMIFDLNKAKQNNTTDCGVLGNLTIELTEHLEDTSKKDMPKNIKYVVINEKDDFYSEYSSNDKTNPFRNYGEISIPILNAQQTKKVLKQEGTYLLHSVPQKFSAPAIDKVVDATESLMGNYPEKAVSIMKKISKRYVDKPEITLSDVQNYIKEASHIFKEAENDSAINMIFDTGIKLKNMVGAEGTKKEISSIVRMIKDKTIGTRGYLIYAQDGSQGAGRKYSAKAIAGEAKIPYIEINTLDFGTEKLDLFGALFGDSKEMTPEASMKKLFELVKSQAETNSSKAAVLFIENFEYFSVGEQVSEFHQKAMSQLLREMDNAKRQGFNIVVMGSMNDPELIGASTLKSGKFVDEIAVESPTRNAESRYDILNYYTKKKKYKIEGSTPEEREAVLKKAADITEGFPYVYLLTFLDKANNIAKERKHRAISGYDFVESKLQIECGRPNLQKISKEYKELTASHECGHALNLQFMYDLLKKQGDIRHLPAKVNFITLDPRGDYGGAMYPGKSENEEWSFGRIFSDIICTFGGHSCEKELYGIDGSWGISSDMEMATQKAQTAIQYMGLGPNMGKIHIDNTITGSLDLSPRMRDKYDKDLELFLNNANLASDMIVETYKPFIEEFTEKYKNLVGTGECIIPSEQFKKELDDWTTRQDKEKLNEIKQLEEDILKLMKDTQRGITY